MFLQTELSLGMQMSYMWNADAHSAINVFNTNKQH